MLVTLRGYRANLEAIASLQVRHITSSIVTVVV